MADSPTPEDRQARLARLSPEQRARFGQRLRGGAPPAAGPADGPVRRADPDAPAPLAPGQERLWFLEQLTPGHAMYNEYAALRLTGPLDTAALDAALTALAVRHDVLRTAFEAGEDGAPHQRVLPSIPPVLRIVDFDPATVTVTVITTTTATAGIGEGEDRGDGDGDGDGDGTDDEATALTAAELALARQEAARPFDLGTEALFRALLIRSSPERALLVVVNHHLVGDAWSRGILVDELGAAYRRFRDHGPDPEPPPLRYADWALWQRRSTTPEALADSLAYWRARLADAPSLLALGTDRPRPPVPGYLGGQIRFVLDDKLTRETQEAAAALRATPFMVTLAAWSAVLLRHSGQEDVVVGVPTAGRDRPEVEGLVGMFVNTLVLRTGLDGDPTFAELVARVRESTLGALAHGHVPFEAVVRDLRPDRDVSHSPLFQAQFNYRNVPAGRFSLPGLTVEPVLLHNGTCRNDLALELGERDGLVEGILEYSSELFDALTAQGFADTFVRVLRGGVADRGARLSTLLALTDEERADLDASGVGRVFDAEPADVLHTFDAVVRDRPEAPALTAADPGGQTTLTFGGLAERVGRIAARLRAAGVRPGDRVGLCLRRTADLPAAMLAVLRVGAAYVPLDPDYPPARTRHVLDAAAPVAVVVHGGTRGVCDPGTAQIDLDEPDAAWGGNGPDGAQAPAPADPESAAYVIYTSGSTGTPKGVVIRRANLAAFLAALDDEFGADQDQDSAPEPSTWLAVTSVSFDISVLELLWTLSRGHHVVLSPDAGSGQAARTTEFSLFYFASDTSETLPGPGRYRLLLDGARFADEHGFAAVWLPERHFHAFGGSYPAPHVLAAAVAQVTQRIGIRAGSVVMPLHHPVRVAEEWAVVDNLSDGRVGLSFASGWHADDFVLAPDAYEDRHRHMAEGLQQVRALWRGQAVPLPAPGGRTVPTAVLPTPVQPELPFWITSSGSPATCRQAGELGANLLTHLLGQDLGTLAQRIAEYREAWRQAGHPGDPHVTLMLHTYIGQDEEDVRARAWEPFRSYLRSSLSLTANLARTLGLDVAAEDFSPADEEALLDHACARYLKDNAMIGTVEQCLDLTRRIVEAGVDEIACLVDFGVAEDAVLASLPRMDALRRETAHRPSGGPAAHAVQAELTGLIEQHAVTHLQCTPSRARMLIEEPGREALRGLRRILLGGEALDADLVRRLSALTDARLHNMYGPTETTVWSTTDPVDPAEAAVTIGRPLTGTWTAVLDPHGRRVPAGVPGELHIGGAGVAAGYLGDPDQTDRRFVPAVPGPGMPVLADPSSPLSSSLDARMYRTGDIVRVRRDGRLDYLARNDQQVKIRGYRVEPAEVEAALVAAPGVGQAVVRLWEPAPGDRRLAGYLTPLPGARLDLAAVREDVAARLPAYLVPAVLTVLDTLPLTPNGKLDRGALPEPAGLAGPGGAGSSADPTGPAAGSAQTGGSARAAILQSLFAEQLGVAQVGPHDDFFRLGGHSLLAIQLVNRIRGVLGTQVSVRALFEAPTPSGLAGRLGTPDGRPRPALRPAARPEHVPLSPGQWRLWFLDRLQGAGAVWNDPMITRIEGDIDLAALRAAVHDLVERHESLRTVFTEHDDEPVQQVLPMEQAQPQVRFTRCEADEVDALVRMESEAVFRLDRDIPIRLHLFTSGPQEHTLVLVMHHIAMDGTSMRPLFGDLSLAYAARGEGRAPDWKPLPVQYADYTLWNREVLGDEADEHSVAAAQSAFWRRALDGLPDEVPLPFDRPRPERPTHQGRALRLGVSPLTHRRMAETAGRHSVTLFMLIQAALVTTLTRMGGGTDVPLGTMVVGRGDDALRDLVGYFANTVVLRTDASGDPTFAELLTRIREADLAAYDHADLPFDRVVEAVQPQRGRARTPLFQVMLAWAGAGGGDLDLPGLRCTAEPTDTLAAKTDLGFQIDDVAPATADGPGGRPGEGAGEEGSGEGSAEAFGGLSVLVRYAAELFDAETALGLGRRMVGVLEQAVADPDRRIGDFDMLLPHERQWMFEPPSDAVPRRPETLAAAFARQVAARPDDAAVVDGESVLTYRDLDARADRLADELRDAGVGPGSVVPVLMRRSADLIAAFLGVLKAGGAYLPLEAAHPVAYLTKILPDGTAEALVVDEEHSGHELVRQEAATSRRIVHAGKVFARTSAPDSDGPRSGLRPSPALGPDPSDLAYVMHTSGSTGAPKGVEITQQSVVELALDPCWEVTADDRVLFQAPHAFDGSTYEIWAPLLAGGRVVVAPPGVLNAARLRTLITEHGLTRLSVTAGLFRVLAEDAPESFRDLAEVTTGGDVIPPSAVHEVCEACPETIVRTTYGPTEMTLCVTHQPWQGGERPDLAWPATPLGTALAHTRLYVLDDRMQPVPPGVAGELCLAGAGQARGYRGRPGLTAERFAPDPFVPGERMYRTGDLARWTHAGELIFLGRADHQVKIRGFRVEAGEVEAVLARVPGVTGAVVLIGRDAHGDKRLTGFYTGQDGAAPSPGELARALAERLPPALVPAVLIPIAALPLTGNGKVDRTTLAALAETSGPRSATVPGVPAVPGGPAFAGVRAVDPTPDPASAPDPAAAPDPGSAPSPSGLAGRIRTAISAPPDRPGHKPRGTRE